MLIHNHYELKSPTLTPVRAEGDYDKLESIVGLEKVKSVVGAYACKVKESRLV